MRAAQPGDRDGEPFFVDRLDDVVEGTQLERPQRVLVERGDEDDLRAMR